MLLSVTSSVRTCDTEADERHTRPLPDRVSSRMHTATSHFRKLSRARLGRGATDLAMGERRAVVNGRAELARRRSVGDHMARRALGSPWVGVELRVASDDGQPAAPARERWILITLVPNFL